MNAGFSNFATLKAYLLGGSTAKADTRFDVVIKQLGLGTAAALENFCQRKFGRVVNATQILPADRVRFLLNRFPVESVSKFELKQNETTGFVEQALTNILTINNEAGIIQFPERADVGSVTDQVRFTFTGGYWWDTTEPDDEGYPAAQPEGATVLPEDLKLAWLLQCEAIWSKRDKLGSGLVDDPDAQSQISTLELSPMVKQMLSQFVRFNLV